MAHRTEQIGDAVLHLGDCREILPTIGRVDAVVTDPPYGIGFDYRSYNDTRDNLIGLIREIIQPLIGKTDRVCVLPGMTQVFLYPEPDWIGCIAWNTTGSFGKYGFTQWMPALLYGADVKGFGSVNGVLKSDVITFSGGAGVGFQRDGDTGHPCPKPQNLMSAVVVRTTDPSSTVLDPFMGIGTTGIACVKNGRRFVGIEIDPDYFDIAYRRIEQAYRQRDLFIEAPVPEPPEDFRARDLFAEPNP